MAFTRFASLRVIPLALLFSTPAHATLYTVGTGGTHASIQDAIDAAVHSAGDDEIRIHVDTYDEHVLVPNTLTGQLTISGGWGNGFLTKVRNGAASTIISPTTEGTGVTLKPAAGAHVVLADLTISNAKATNCAGFRIEANGTSTVAIEDSFVLDNDMSTSAGTARGGGGCVLAKDSAAVTVSGTTVQGNKARVTGLNGNAEGGGLAIDCYNDSHCDIVDTLILQNRLEAASNAADGAGLYLDAQDASVVTVKRSVFSGQEIGGTPNPALGLSVHVVASALAQVEIAQSLFLGGGATPASAVEAELFAWPGGAAQVLVDNDVFAHSVGAALQTRAYADSQVTLMQLTLVDNGAPSFVDAFGTVPPLVYDNIFAGGAAEITIGSGATAEHNLLVDDPGFVAPSLDDFSLRGGNSPAVNAGSTTRDVGLYDVSGAPRVQDDVVDIGAYESSDRVFAARFDP